MIKKNTAVKTVSIMFLLTFSAKILGQLREMLAASAYGTGDIANAYQAASQIPLLFFEISLGAAISSTFIPVFNEIMQLEGREKAFRFSSNFVWIVCAIAAFFSLAGILLADQIIGLVAPGLNENATIMAVNILRIMLPIMIFTAASYSFAGILQSLEEFNTPAAMSLISNLLVILYFLLLNRYLGVYGLAVFVLLGWILQLVILVPALRKKQYHLSFVFDPKDSGIVKTAKLALPVFISVWVQPINSMININLASHLNDGQAVSALSYANKLYVIISSVFTLVLTNYIFPKMSRLYTAGDKEGVADVLRSSLRIVVLIILPIMILFMTLATPIIRLIYERGAFDAMSTRLTATALLFYSVGMLALGLMEVFNKTFYAMQKSKIPMRVSMIGITLNIILSIVLSNAMGLGGIALASSIAMISMAFLLGFQMRRYVPHLFDRAFVSNTVKILISGGVMTAVVLLLNPILAAHFTGGFLKTFLWLAIAASAGGIAYLAAAVFLRVDEIIMVLNKFLKKGSDSDA